MRHHIDDLKRLLSHSDLPETDTKTFLAFLEQGDRREIRKITELFEEYPEYIGIVYRFAVLKSQAAEKQDVKAFKEVIKEEINFLEKI